jgi:septum formation protein
LCGVHDYFSTIIRSRSPKLHFTLIMRADWYGEIPSIGGAKAIAGQPKNAPCADQSRRQWISKWASQKNVRSSLHAGLGLVMVECVWRTEEGDIDLVAVAQQQCAQVWHVGRLRKLGFRKDCSSLPKIDICAAEIDNLRTMELILASESPRRRQFLTDLGLEFQAVAADIDETPLQVEKPPAVAMRLAREKATAIAAELKPAHACLILASDTVVAKGDEMLGKPLDEEDAARMLRRLRGALHTVHTAVCLLVYPDGEYSTRLNSTAVTMRNYSDGEIAAYIATGDPLDKAGAYAIQHPTFAPVARLEGCYTGVMGLPLGEVCDLLAESGIAVLTLPATVCAAHGYAGPCCQARATMPPSP